MNNDKYIKEDRVTPEIAKLLRDKGFDEPCDFIYDEDNLKWVYHAFIFLSDGGLATNSKLKDIRGEIVTAPTVQMALKWLREVHNIHIAVNLTYSKDPKLFPPEYYVYINNTLTGESLIKEVCSLVQDKTLTPKGFKRSEDACNEAIKFVLENLI